MSDSNDRDKRKNVQQVNEWMHMIADEKTQEAVMTHYEMAGYNLSDLLEPDMLEYLSVHADDFDEVKGLDIFRNLRVFNLFMSPRLSKDDGHPFPFEWARGWDFHLPNSWAQLEELNISNRTISSINLPKSMNKLKTLHIECCSPIELQLPEHAPELEEISIIGFQDILGGALERLTVSGYPSLKTIEMIEFDCEELTISHLPALEYFQYTTVEDPIIPLCYLEAYDVPKLKRIKLQGIVRDLWLAEKDESLDATADVHDAPLPEENDSLAELDLGKCTLLSLTLPKKTSWLERLDLSGKRLGELQLSEEMPRLIELNLSDNKLTELILPKSLPALEILNISRNHIQQIPVCDMPNLRELNAAYTDILSWRDIPISNPQMLEKLSAQISAPEELDEIRERFPCLRKFLPFIVDDMDMNDLFDRWTDGERDYLRKTVYLPGMICKIISEGKYEIPFSAFPGLSSLDTREYTMWDSPDVKIYRDRQVVCLSDLNSDQYFDVRKKLCTDYIRYHFRAFTNIPGLVMRNAAENPPIDGCVFLKNGILTLKLVYKPESLTRGTLKIENYVFHVKDGTWDTKAAQLSWKLPHGFDCTERKIEAHISGFFPENWVKASPHCFLLRIWGDEGSSRTDLYPAKHFLSYFPDDVVRQAVIAQYPDVDFSENSKEVVCTCTVEEIYVENPESLEGLEILTNLQRYHQKGGLFVHSHAFLEKCKGIDVLMVEDAILGHVVFPRRFYEREITFKGCRLFESSPAYEGGYIDLGAWMQVQLRRVSITDMKQNINMKSKIVLPRRGGIREIDLHNAGFSDIELPERNPQLEKIDLRGNNFAKSFTIAGYDLLRFVLLSHDDGRDSELTEIQLFDLPNLTNLSIENFPKLKTLRLPRYEDRTSLPITSDWMVTDIPLLPGITISDCPALTSLTFPNEERYTGWITACDCGLTEIVLPDFLPEDVNLRNNRLTELPDFGKQNRLEHLDVSGNRLEALTLGETPALCVLDCSRNNIEALNLPKILPELELLFMNNNPIDRMPEISIPKLAVLYAGNTGIASWKDLKIANPNDMLLLSAKINDPAELDEIEHAFPNLIDFQPCIDKSMDLTALFSKWNGVAECENGLVANYKHLWKCKRIFGPVIRFHVRGYWGKEYARIDFDELPGIKEFLNQRYKICKSREYARSSCTVDLAASKVTVENLVRVAEKGSSGFSYQGDAIIEICDKCSIRKILYNFSLVSE